MAGRNTISPFDYISGFHYMFYSITNGSAAANWKNIGNTEEGSNLHRAIHEEDIHDDAYGSSRADTVQQGADYELSGALINLNAAQDAGVFDAQQVAGQTNNKVGLLGSSYYGSICLAPLPGTPAAAFLAANFANAECIIAGLAAIANDYSMLLSSKQRKVPVTFKFLPDQANGNLAYYTGALPAGITLPVAPPIG